MKLTILGMAMILAMTPPMRAGTVATDNMANDKTGSAPAGWTITTGGTTTAVIAAESGTNFLHMVDKDNTAGSEAANQITASFPLGSEPLDGIIQFDFRLNEPLGSTDQIVLGMGPNRGPCVVLLGGGDNPYLQSGNTPFEKVVEPVKLKTWYTVTLVFTAATEKGNNDTGGGGKMKIYINGVLKNEGFYGGTGPGTTFPNFLIADQSPVQNENVDVKNITFSTLDTAIPQRESK